MIVVLAFAFSLLLRSPSLGTSFILFYATGLLPFRMYQEAHSVTSSAVRYSKALLVYPVVSYIDALFARLILAFMTQLMISYLILAGIFIFVLDVRLILDFQPIITAFVIAAFLGFGIGAINCVLFEYFPIWKSLWSTANRPLMLFSAIIYIYEDLPKFAADLLWFNPLAHLTGLSRTGFYSYYEPDYILLAYPIGIALVTTVLGLIILRRHHRRLRTL